MYIYKDGEIFLILFLLCFGKVGGDRGPYISHILIDSIPQRLRISHQYLPSSRSFLHSVFIYRYNTLRLYLNLPFFF